MSKLVLIDSNAILHRAYHALPSTLRTKKGKPINAVYGFVSMLLKIVNDLEPTHIAACFDLKEPTFRKKAFVDYQAHRPEMDKDLDVQFDKAKKVVRSFGIPIYEKAGFEADDVIGTLAKQATEDTRILGYKDTRKKSKKSPNILISQYPNIQKVVIVTGDKDILQLVTNKVKVYMPVKGLSESLLMGVNEVVEKLGVKPTQIVDYKALVGDPSDNYKGVPGIGPKTAAKLIQRFKSVNQIYKNLNKIDKRVAGLLQDGKESAKMSQKLAKIITDVDIKPDFNDMDDWGVGRSETIKIFSDFGFKTLTRRIKEFKGGVNFKDAVLFVVEKLKNYQYAIRGTASLVLQGLDMNVDDIDIITDRKTALACNRIFKKFLVRRVEHKTTEKFKSYFGEFEIEGMSVEVMGEWQIKKDQSWGKKYDANSEQITHVSLKGKKIPVTRVETELMMFSQMGRWNAYHKIKKQVDKRNQQSLF